MKKEYSYVDYFHYEYLACPACGKHHAALGEGYQITCSCGSTLRREGNILQVHSPDLAPAPDRPIVVNVFYGSGFMNNEDFGKAVCDALRKALKEGK